MRINIILDRLKTKQQLENIRTKNANLNQSKEICAYTISKTNFKKVKKSNMGIANVKVKQNLRSVSDGWVFAQC